MNLEESTSYLSFAKEDMYNSELSADRYTSDIQAKSESPHKCTKRKARFRADSIKKKNEVYSVNNTEYASSERESKKRGLKKQRNESDHDVRAL